MKVNKKKKNSIWNALGIIYLSFIAIGLFLAYGPFDWVKNTLITTAMTTMNHQWMAEIVYSDETIAKVLSEQAVIEPDEDTEAAFIEIKDITAQSSYTSKEEEQILKKDPDNKDYKIIPIEGYVNPVHYYKGYLVAIYDPSNVKMATSKFLGKKGQYIKDMAKENKARLAINASGFVDPEWMGNGGAPHGVIIKDSKVVWGQNSGTVNMIGFNKQNILMLGKMTSSQAMAKGIRDGMSFEPFLIINGKPSFIKGDGGWGLAPRTAIGQRKDGIVLFLTIDGRQKHSVGADMVDLTEIMKKYGAHNAANMDGGSSTALIENGLLITKPTALGQEGLRTIPNAWIME